MTTLVFLIEQIAPGLYILLGVGVLWLWRRWARARHDLRATHFEFERDLYRNRAANALTSLMLFIEAALVIVGVQQVVAPTLRITSLPTIAEVVIDPPFNTPTPPPVNFSQSPIDSSGVIIGENDTSGQIQLTAVPTATPVGTLLPNPPPVEGCDSPEATLQIPGNGMLVFSPIRVVGAAYTDNFSSYRFELKGASTLNNFAPLADYSAPVTEIGDLGQFVPSFYEPGQYQFRLTVFDISNTLRAACTVNITISEPIPTSTPLAP